MTSGVDAAGRWPARERLRGRREGTARCSGTRPAGRVGVALGQKCRTALTVADGRTDAARWYGRGARGEKERAAQEQHRGGGRGGGQRGRQPRLGQQQSGEEEEERRGVQPPRIDDPVHPLPLSRIDLVDFRSRVAVPLGSRMRGG